jgi:hypothetical protein
MRKGSFVLSAAVLAILVACKSEEVHEVTLKFARPSKVQRGFECLDSTTRKPLFDRLTTNGGKGSLVVDFVLLGGLPHCRPLQLAEWCRSHPCPLDVKERYCTPVVLPNDGTSRVDAIVQTLDDLSKTVVSRSAPDAYVLVRAVLTSESCDALAAGADFDRKRLAGCVYSCPVLLSSVDGDLLLDLDAITLNCEDAVDACASINGDDASGAAR